MALSERAQERQFTCGWLSQEYERLATFYGEMTDAYFAKRDLPNAMHCNSMAEAFKVAAANARSFGCVVEVSDAQ